MSVKINNKNKALYFIKQRLKQYLYSYNYMLFTMSGSHSNNLLFNKIYIETVSCCNNDCAFCPASVTNKVKSPDSFMQEKLYLKVLEELVSLNYQGSVAFHCNNEPLLDKRLPNFVKLAREKLKNNFFYIYTNGILINTDLANSLFVSGLNRVIVNNYNDDYKLIPSIKDIVKNNRFIKGEVIVNYRLKNEYLFNRAGQSPNVKNPLRKPLKAVCLRPLKEIVVGYDGTVPLCGSDGLWKMRMGNVRELSIKDIWFSEGFNRVREALIKGDRGFSDICRVCDVVNFPKEKGV